MPYDSGMIFGGVAADDAGDIGVSLDNLGELDRVLASAAQRREAHLYELAYSLVRPSRASARCPRAIAKRRSV